jgi:hypothetical protein
MNPRTSEPLLCRAVRWRIERFQGDSQASGHVARCPDCQEHFAFWSELEQAARTSAPAWRANIPVEVQRRAREVRARPRRPAPRPWFPATSLAGLAAAAALAWFAWHAEPKPVKLVPDDLVARLEVIAIARENAAVAANLFPDVPGSDGLVHPRDRALARTAIAEATVGRVAGLVARGFASTKTAHNGAPTEVRIP